MANSSTNQECLSNNSSNELNERSISKAFEQNLSENRPSRILKKSVISKAIKKKRKGGSIKEKVAPKVKRCCNNLSTDISVPQSSTDTRKDQFLAGFSIPSFIDVENMHVVIEKCNKIKPDPNEASKNSVLQRSDSGNPICQETVDATIISETLGSSVVATKNLSLDNESLNSQNKDSSENSQLSDSINNPCLTRIHKINRKSTTLQYLPKQKNLHKNLFNR